MLTFRLTQKLASSLRVSLSMEGPSAVNPCTDWCCHRFASGRLRYLLVTNASTFYSAVLRGQGMGNASDFIAGVISGLRGYLVAGGHELEFTQLIGTESGEVRFRPVGDRRILGVMNEFIFMAKAYLADLSPAETSDRLNVCPVGPLEGKAPVDIFPPKLISRVPGQ
jgi:hypothetical protein